MAVVYMKFRPKVPASQGQVIYTKDVAVFHGESTIIEKLQDIPIKTISKMDKSHVVIDVMEIITILHDHMEDIDIQTVGPVKTIIEVQNQSRAPSPFMIMMVWFLLFVGAGLAVMNFHEDVSMLSVHQKLYEIVTGEEVEKPLLLQIPYSLGLGIGMILFFNHLFRKRINEEPSPLEVEMFNYQQDLDRYVMAKESSEKGTE